MNAPADTTRTGDQRDPFAQIGTLMQNHDTTQDNNTVLVIGGGVGGIKAALDLAEAARDVVMIDKAFAIGGLMTQLDRTFPTNNCDLCTLSPHLAESGRRLHIELLTGTQLDRVAGQAGRFTVTLRSAPRYIDLSQCTACGKCFQEFPECVRFRPGLDHRAPTCMRYPKTTPEAFSIALEKCPDVEALVRLCPAGAIRPEDAEQTRTLQGGRHCFSPRCGTPGSKPAGQLGLREIPQRGDGTRIRTHPVGLRPHGRRACTALGRPAATQGRLDSMCRLPRDQQSGRFLLLKRLLHGRA